LTNDTCTFNYTNADTYTDIHSIIIVSRVLLLTHRAKQFCNGVLRLVVIIVILWVIVQTSMCNPTINMIKIFTITTSTRNNIMKRVKRGDVIMIVVQCEQAARRTSANVTTCKAGDKAIIQIIGIGTVPSALTSPPLRVAASHSAAATPQRGYCQSATTSISPETLA